MGYKSKKNGKKGEETVVDFFSERHFWVHLVKRGPSGSQPLDIIAIRQNESWLVDAKYISAGKCGRFSFEDIQPNQVESMHYARDYAGIDNLGFVLVFEDYLSIKGSIRFMSLAQWKSERP